MRACRLLRENVSDDAAKNWKSVWNSSFSDPDIELPVDVRWLPDDLQGLL